MRRIDLTFSALLVPLDFFALLAAAMTAYALRFSRAFLEIRPLIQDIPYSQFLATAVSFAFVWLVLFAIAGLYSLRPHKAWGELGRIILASTAGIMVVIATVFFRREFTTSRFLVLAFWGLAILYVWVGRLILRAIRHELLRARVGHQRIVVIGSDKSARELAALYKTHPTLGWTVVKTLAVWNDAGRRDMDALVRKGRLEGIVLADPNLPREPALDLIAFAEERHLTFRYLADVFAARFTNVEMSTDGGIPIIEVKPTPLDGWGRIAKRLFDILVSAILIIILSPVMLLAALAIKLDSKGFIFYRLDDDSPPKRIGEHGKPFRYLKFRSMYPHTHMMRYRELKSLDVREGPLVKIKEDPRVTRVGRFIRKWSIDELPELFLVLGGRMSLVGPRPHLPEEVARYKPHHRRVMAVKPGITGMAQISGRSDLGFEDEVQLDTWYIKNWSLGLDLLILLKTPLAVLRHRKTEEGV